MSGTGKYTTYAPEAGGRTQLLGKIFGKDAGKHGKNTPPFQMNKEGKEVEIRNAIVENAILYLTPVTQQGDGTYFAGGVNLDFTGQGGAPILLDVKWKQAGDSANPFTPDITSPGPGKTEASQKSVDPDIAYAALKPDYVPGGPDTGTKSPSDTAKKIASRLLGVTDILGKSGGDALFVNDNYKLVKMI